MTKIIDPSEHTDWNDNTNDRNAEVVQDIRDALQTHNLSDTFWSLPFSHQREYTKWINEAKRPETRAKRIQKMCEMLISAKRN